MWPEKNISFIVIHGMGPHRPFQRLDDFARGFWQMLINDDKTLPSQVKWEHRLMPHSDWIEHYVSLEVENRSRIEFYEYYWDCYMVREITSRELVKWLDQVSQGAKKFYQDNPGIAGQHRANQVPLFRDDDLKYLNYAYPILANFKWIKWLGPLLVYLPTIGPAMKLLAGPISRWLRENMTDLVVYTSSDVRSQNYKVRQAILKGAVEEIRPLLAKKDSRIVLVGHSLGSVIAYDALNRINLEINTAEKPDPEQAGCIGGLVTFGSPLDKIFFFFNEPTTREKYVQRQVLSHFHGYKSREQPVQDPVNIGNPIHPRLNGSTWLNFYHLNDLVSGCLDAYRVDDNILCDYPANIAQAHNEYWSYEKMYRTIAERYF